MSDNPLPAEGMASAEAAPVERHAYLDGLRFLVAAFLILHHTFVDFTDYYPNVGRFSNLFAYNAGYGVDLFFVLSGFCLLLPLLRGGSLRQPSTLRFLAKRSVRLLVPYYAGLALSLLLIAVVIDGRVGHHWDMSVDVTPSDLWHALTLTQNYFGRPSPGNYSYWFIPAIFYVSVLSPLLVLAWRVLGPVFAFAALATVSGLLGSTDALPQVAGVHLTTFLVGMLAASIAFDARGSMRVLRSYVPWKTVALGLGAVVALQFWDVHNQSALLAPLRDFKWVLFSVAFGCTLVAWSKDGFGFSRRILGWRPLAVLGTRSYSVYLVHAPIVELTHRYVLPKLSLGEGGAQAFSILLLIPFICVAAEGFYRLFERDPLLTFNACAHVPRRVFHLAKDAAAHANHGLAIDMVTVKG